MNKTIFKELETKEKKWYLINADGQTLGRLATFVARKLMGKDKIIYTPHSDEGDNIIIINARKVKTTGNKDKQKIYYYHSGRPGGLRTESLQQLKLRLPNRIIEKAIKGMLPKGTLGRKLFTKLKVYNDSQHPHEAQKPDNINILFK
uniref:Large ribosomal subunit protein uL13c n=1 Tax=Compsopogon caeruleus TaxID=31354 RepID=A0A1Z1XB96_9RHOD|nr:50S ribosomal protein L13 [Compsopogon caeruleus]ARX96098.1 50S ribosomal protein L13 [Compsopogon caeruleus]